MTSGFSDGVGIYKGLKECPYCGTHEEELAEPALRELASWARSHLPGPYRERLLNQLDLVGIAPAPTGEQGKERA